MPHQSTPRFLLYISQPYSIPIGRPLQEELHHRGYEVAWFCDEEATGAHLHEQERLLHHVHDVLAFNPHVVLSATNTVPDFFPGIKVQIFHGFSVGKRSNTKGHFNIRGFFDLYCTQGPNTTLPFQELQQKYRHFDVVETGWPKMDPLFPLQPHSANRRPVIMIASTFTPRLSLAHHHEVRQAIARLSRQGQWDFIAVLHPKMDPNIVAAFQALENEHFTFYPTTDLIPLYRKADLMISDTTSAVMEFLLQGKPVVTINNNRPAPYLINITDVAQLDTAIAAALMPSKELIAHIDTVIEETHPYRDGHSSRRVVDAALHFLEHRHSRPKPLNWLRKYAIRRKLHYFPCIEKIKKWFS